MTEEKLEEYRKKDPQILLAVMAYKVDVLTDTEIPAINEHLKTVNGRCLKHQTVLAQLEEWKKSAEKEEENKYRAKLEWKKFLGGFGIAIVASGLTLLGTILTAP